MFKWLSDKINEKYKSEMQGCIIQNLRFVDFVRKQDNINPNIDIFIDEINNVSILMQSKMADGEDLTSDERSQLLDVNMNCRRIWANEFGGSDLKFDKEFKTND
jgi:hypothetical protein